MRIKERLHLAHKKQDLLAKSNVDPLEIDMIIGDCYTRYACF
jgi:hypothetical protein